MKPRNSWEFQVKHFVPCPECKQMVSEAEMTKRRARWIAGYGWKEFPVSCEPCYDAMVKATEDLVKQEQGLLFKGWDHV